MQVLNLKSDSIPKGQDYIFESYDEFQKLKEYLKYKKIEGTPWKICFVGISIQDARAVHDYNFPEFVEVTLCLKKDVMVKFLQEHNKIREAKKSKWDLFLEHIAEFPIVIDQKAANEIFKRTNGNLEKTREILENIKTMFYDVGCIQVEHVNAVSIREDKVYARDVILALLIKYNPLVPSKGHPLSGYKYKDWRKLYDKLCKELGEEIAFYALRKSVIRLYEEKVSFLNNEEVKSDIAVMEVVDVYELMHAYILFITANKKQTEAVLRIIEGRKRNAGLFEKTILSYIN